MSTIALFALLCFGGRGYRRARAAPGFLVPSLQLSSWRPDPRPYSYNSSNPNHRTPAPHASGAGGPCRVKILLPIVAFRRLGYSDTFSSSSFSTALGERTVPHLHSP